VSWSGFFLIRSIMEQITATLNKEDISAGRENIHTIILCPTSGLRYLGVF
jgi:hypothetical protein